MSDAVKKQAEGVCEEISEKNGWTTFHINVGRKYPLRLETKLDALIKEGRAAGNQKAVWSFSEHEGAENPNRPGTHYINRRLEGVEVGGTLDPAIAAAASAAATSQGGATQGGSWQPKSAEERSSIERQTIVKAAVPVYESFASDDAFFSFLDRLAQFISAASDQKEEVPPPPAPTVSEGPYENEDDIPF